MLKLTALLSAAILAFAGLGSATPVAWSYQSRADLSETSVLNVDGSRTYTLSLANSDESGIWFASFYTGEFQAYDLHSSLADWEANAYTQFAPAGEDWSLPGAADAWMVSFYDADPSFPSLSPGQTATVGFTVAGALEAPIRYGYSIQDDFAWNRYTAIGPPAEAVPEPSGLALFGLGFLLLAVGSAYRNRGAGGLAALVPLLLGVSAVAPAFSATDLAISQVYGGGGNSGATLVNDFIELHNRGNAPVDLAGWSVQYASAAGTTWQRTLLSGVIPVGGYYLVQQAAGTGGSQPLPTPDITGTIAMSATAGKVALSPVSAVLTGACPGGLADLVGYGTANCFETSAAPGLSNTTADVRVGNGCTDTDDNASDFASGAPAPRNSASAVFACGGGPDASPQVASMVPVPGSANASAGTDILITFSEPVSVNGSWFALSGTMSGTHPATVSGGPTVFTLNPVDDFLAGENVFVTVFSGQISDLDTQDPPDNPESDFNASFLTTAPATIASIQGKGHLSPRAGQAVAGVLGVVTAVLGNGFFMQDPDPDSDIGTSDGIFVFTNSAPTVSVGNLAAVGGNVSEFRPGGASSANLTITELVSPSVQILSAGNPLPAPVLIGAGGRYPPHEVIDDDAEGSVETSGSYDPLDDGIDFYESLEGMRVQMSDPVAVSPRSGFGEILVLGDGGAGAGLRTPRGGIKVRSHDFNPERIMVDDALTPTPSVNVGDAFAGPITGVLDYQFGNYRILPASLPPVLPGNLQPEVSPSACDKQLTVATFNVENLDPSDPQEKFDRLAGVIVHNLKSPMIIALEEMQDNNGAVNNGTVDAAETAALLISSIHTAGGPAYLYKDIAPANNQDGGEPGGNIRVGFLYRNGNGLNFVSRPGGTAVNSVKPIKTPSGIRLNYSPGRIDPLNTAFANSRKPLAVEFSYHGRTLFLIANHFNSKGGDHPLMGRFQPPVRSSEAQRKLQASAVNAFTQSVLALDPCARVIALGDFNDFEFSEVLSILKGSAYVNLMESLPENERYSYVFEGNSQSLDHILVTKTLADLPNRFYDVVHVNAEFSNPVSDHEPQRACFEKGHPVCPIGFP